MLFGHFFYILGMDRVGNSSYFWFRSRVVAVSVAIAIVITIVNGPLPTS